MRIHQKAVLILIIKTAQWSLLLGGLSNLCLLCSAYLQHTVLTLLALLAGWALAFIQSMTGQTMLGFEFLGVVESVVDKSEASWFATSKVGSESKYEASVWGYFVHGSELVADLLFGHRGESWMNNVTNHLLAAQQAVRHELARTNSGCRHCHRI